MIAVQRQNQIFLIEDKTTGIDLFESGLRCVTLHYNMAHLCRGGKWEVLGRISKSNCYRNGGCVREIMNEVNATVDNTASIECQGLNVQILQRNKKSAGW